MRLRQSGVTLLAVVVSTVLVGCGGSGPNQAAKDACGDLRKASADYESGNVDAATYLGLLGVVAANASKSEEKDMIGASVVLQSALLSIDESDTLGDLEQVGSKASMMGDACDGLGL